jgi:murein L,D-transpeptidase YafK
MKKPTGRITAIVISAFIAVMAIISLSPLHADFFQDQLKYSRVRTAKAEKAGVIRNIFKKKGVDYPPADIFIRIFKLDRAVELWARSKNTDAFTLIKTYKICALSGRAGPKRRVGDKQIPEGFYHISVFNPVSSFYLSLGINYPNTSDRILGVKGRLGGDIFIHGNCVTIGCVPITDDCIEELYLIAVEAKAHGQGRIPVHIFPTRLEGDNYLSLRKSIKDANVLSFWENLQPGYSSFEKERLLPRVSVDTKTGKYLFQ